MSTKNVAPAAGKKSARGSSPSSSPAAKKAARSPAFARYLEHVEREGSLIFWLFMTAFLMIALATYSPADPGWSSTSDRELIENYAGRSGAWVADILRFFFGHVAYLFPLVFGLKAISVLRSRITGRIVHWPVIAMRLFGVMLIVCSLTAIFDLYAVMTLPLQSGGALGHALGELSTSGLNIVGSTLLWIAALFFGFSLATGFSWLRFMDLTGEYALRTAQSFGSWTGIVAGWTGKGLRKSSSAAAGFLRKRNAQRQAEKAARSGVKRLPKLPAEGAERAAVQSTANSASANSQAAQAAPAASSSRPPEGRMQAAGRAAATAAAEAAEKAVRISPFQRKKEAGARRDQPSLFDTNDSPIPPLSLLDPSEVTKKGGYSEQALIDMSRLLEAKLADFGISVEVVEVNPGPVITRFEIQPAPGIKVSRISNLVKDLARSLAVVGVRVVEVIPGKSVVGIEIPNENRDIVRLREVLSCSDYENMKSPLALGLGNDIAGNPVVADLAKMPHLLVAGTTGSGKSVGVNAMILSMLFKSTPEELRLIMIDPKMLELSIYDGIPHLLTPVVVDMKEAANALRWCVGEMERRYRLMSALGVRNLAGFNRKVKDALAAGEGIPDPLWNPSDSALAHEPPALGPVPHIVVVIDEFADMMMIVGKKVEELIARIAQKARAAGIHLILATQRPSVDVITGLIKANVPTRMAFQVSSKIDSRTILDQGGAEQLLGHGDMLYMPPGTSLPVRVHGAFVDDDEVHRVVAEWKRRGEPDYLTEILDGTSDSDFVQSIDGSSGGGENGDGEQDALYDEAVAFVIDSRKASISSVQRRLKVGYNRAANLVDAMEAAGVISAAGHNGAREVLSPPSRE
ncbi:DNA translocase FtsK [Allohahella marinimesophila]|uniref:DNA translocase FtsK n=1 Tax=Allohahella marinimesophila TaxID=1054972 RepID=A0ABP7NYB2_9GAMM